MFREALAHSEHFPVASASGSAGTSGGGGGGGLPSRVSRIHFPRTTGEVRVGIRRQSQNTALPQQSSANAVRHRDAPELVAINIRDTVMARQTLVHERVIRVQQLQNAAVAEQHIVEQQIGLAFKRQPQVVVEFGKYDRIGSDAFHHPER